MVLCFTKYLLDERHQFAKIWLAAHWEKKIKRSQVFEIDIVRSVQEITSAEVIFDLRISGHLLIGIVKIHSRKVKYLLSECNTIFYQVKIFRTGEIDLPHNKQTARVNDITLTELFDDIGNIENDILDTLLTSNQSRIEDITLKETNEKLTLCDEDDLIEFEFQEEDEGFIFDDDFIKNYEKEMSALENTVPNPIDISKAIEQTTEEISKAQVNFGSDYFLIENDITEIPETFTTFDESGQIRSDQPVVLSAQNDLLVPDQSSDLENSVIEFCHTTTDELYLEPVKISRICTSNKKKAKKRKIIMDNDKTLSHDVIKKQMLDVSDITSAFDLAPASRRLMILKNIGTAEQLLCLPSLKILNDNISHVYKRNLKTCKQDKVSFEEDDVSENYDSSQSKSKKKQLNNKVSLAETFTECTLEQVDFVNNIQSDLPYMNGEFMEEMESTCMAFENMEEDFNVLPRETKSDFNALPEEIKSDFKVLPQETKLDFSVLPQETESDYNHIQSNTLELQSTQMSKTSEEKWEYVLQGRIIQTLLHLQVLFEENSVICFSSFVRNKKKHQVAQTFLCLLMLKKFQIISLQQSQCFDEIFISPEDRFDDFCSKIGQS